MPSIKNSLFLFLLLSFQAVFSSETVIQGKLDGFENKPIRIAYYTNYITYQKEWIAKSTIEDNTFKFSFDLENTTQIIIRVEDKETILFAEPGMVYNIRLSYNTTANEGQAFNKLLDLDFSFPKPENINLQIKDFNKAYQDFFSANYQRFVIKAAGKEITAFVQKWNKKNETQENVFVKNYITYALANLQDINYAPKKELYHNYLKDNQILYSNKEYMNFFKQYYRQDFEALSLKKDAVPLLQAIMIDNDLDKSRKEIAKLKNIKSPELAELYLLYGLYEVYHSKTINQKSSMQLLEKISKNGENAENKLMAIAIMNQLKMFGKGGSAASFTLSDHVGKTVKLEDLLGKVVYLNFWANWSIPSLRELKVLQKLHEKYGDKINFVSINLDEDPNLFKKIKKQNNYAWTFLHYGNDFELREKYDVRTVPTYYLIDAKGKIIKANAKGPTEVERTLYDLIK